MHVRQVQKTNFDCIISNPPYIRSAVDSKELAPEVKDNEPRIALDGTADGLHFYREIAKGALDFLVRVDDFFENRIDQGADVSDILIENGYEDVRVTKDLAGNERVVSARLSNR